MRHLLLVLLMAASSFAYAQKPLTNQGQRPVESEQDAATRMKKHAKDNPASKKSDPNPAASAVQWYAPSK